MLAVAWLSSERLYLQLTETDADTYNQWLKSGTPVVELEKGWKKLRRRATS